MRYISLLVLVAVVGCGKGDKEAAAKADADREASIKELMAKEAKLFATMREADQKAFDLKIAELKRQNDELGKKLAAAEARVKELQEKPKSEKPPEPKKD